MAGGLGLGSQVCLENLEAILCMYNDVVCSEASLLVPGEELGAGSCVRR